MNPERYTDTQMGSGDGLYIIEVCQSRLQSQSLDLMLRHHAQQDKDSLSEILKNQSLGDNHNTTMTYGVDGCEFYRSHPRDNNN